MRGRSGGWNRLPRSVKAARGTLRKGRLNALEPQLPAHVPTPPRWLSPEGRRLFRRLGRLIAPLRVCTQPDGEMLALGAAALEEFLAADQTIRAEGTVLTRVTRYGKSCYAHPSIQVRRDAWRRYREALRSFGADPQSRQGVASIPPSDGDSKADSYFQ
jgi:P27 family predicted phage terminase small subunit